MTVIPALTPSTAPARAPAARLQALAGLLALAAGTLVYVVDRPSEATAFLGAINLSAMLPPLYGPLGASLPTFAHALAFSLLTAACLGGQRLAGLAGCCAWLVIDTGFELGQLPAIAAHIPATVPAGFAPVRDYFVRGTFDPADLISIFIGTCVAAGVITLTSRES